VDGYDANNPPEDESQCFRSQIAVDISMLNLIKNDGTRVSNIFSDADADMKLKDPDLLAHNVAVRVN